MEKEKKNLYLKTVKLSVYCPMTGRTSEKEFTIDCKILGCELIEKLAVSVDGCFIVIRNNEKNDRFYSSIGKPNPDKWK
jgi:hypothetical protein